MEAILVWLLLSPATSQRPATFSPPFVDAASCERAKVVLDHPAARCVQVSIFAPK